MLVHPYPTDEDRRWSNARMKTDLVADPARNIRIVRACAASDLLTIRHRIRRLRVLREGSTPGSVESVIWGQMISDLREQARVLSRYMALLLDSRR